MLRLSVKIPSSLERTLLPVVLLFRRLRSTGPYRKIPLTRHNFAFVDPEDYHRLARHKWHLAKSPTSQYAVRWKRLPDGRRKRIWMHRAVMNPPANLVIDHINGNGLDNRKANFRLATHAQNLANRPKQKRPARSKYKGLEFDKRSNKWKARIQHNNRKFYLGSFDSETDAAKAYDNAARIHHGKFASLNFPKTKPPLLARLLHTPPPTAATMHQTANPPSQRNACLDRLPQPNLAMRKAADRRIPPHRKATLARKCSTASMPQQTPLDTATAIC